MSDSKLALTKAQEGVLFNPDYTGFVIDYKSSMYPPVLNILQSDKQFSAFPGFKKSELVDSYGKLFIRTDANSPDDLMDSVTGTIIKIEQGHEVRDQSTNKIVSSGATLLTKEEKDRYYDRGHKPVNMVKILLAMGTPEEVGSRLEEYKKKAAEGEASRADFPFAVVVIKGTSWGSWIDAQKAMEKRVSEAFPGKRLGDVISTLFTLKVGSKEEEGSFGSYYSVTLEPGLNEVEDATAFSQYMLEMKDIGLFFNVSERVEEKEKVEKIFEDMTDVVDADDISSF